MAPILSAQESCSSGIWARRIPAVLCSSAMGPSCSCSHVIRGHELDGPEWHHSHACGLEQTRISHFPHGLYCQRARPDFFALFYHIPDGESKVKSSWGPVLTIPSHAPRIKLNHIAKGCITRMRAITVAIFAKNCTIFSMCLRIICMFSILSSCSRIPK